MTRFIDEKHCLAHWGRIIRDEAPCGEDLSLDPEFESLAEEIGKDKSLHGDQKTDWVAVYGLADSLLARSKDVWVFAYGTVAVYHVKSVPDCIYCINSLTELLSTQWQSLHPALERPKRRLAPLKWMCDKFHSIADNTAFLSLNPTDLGALNDAFISLQEKIDFLLPENELSFGSILRAQLEGVQESTPAPGQTGAPTDPKPPGSVSVPPSQPQLLQTALEDIEKRSLIPPAVLPQLIRAINDNARQVGDHLLAINKEDERAYQLHRIAIWGTLLQLPPADASGLTQLSCPIPPEMIATYTSAVNDKRHAEILPQIERAASKAPFWFDGQHLIVKCLEGLSATLPALSVKHSLAQLVKRFPELPSLKFRDGRPFASPKTATWIDSFLPVIFGNSSSGANGRTLLR